MLNERELIEHWALRDRSVWLTYALLAFALAGMALFLVAGLVREGGGLWLVLGGVDGGVVFILAGWLRRTWRRLGELEEFIP